MKNHGGMKTRIVLFAVLFAVLAAGVVLGAHLLTGAAAPTSAPSPDVERPPDACVEPDAEVKPDAKPRPKTPLEEVLQVIEDKSLDASDRLELHVAAAVAHAAVGQGEKASGLLQEAEKLVAGSPKDKAEALGLIACGLLEASLAERATSRLQQIEKLVEMFYSNEKEHAVYNEITDECINMGVRSETVRPFIDRMLGIANKQKGVSHLDSDAAPRQIHLNVAGHMARLRDARGVTALVRRMRLASHDADLLSRVAEHLWRAGNQKRARQLLDRLRIGRDVVSHAIARVAGVQALVGREEQARKVLERAVTELRRESGSARRLRKQIAVAFARLGELEKARVVVANEPIHRHRYIEVLVEVDRLDEALELVLKTPPEKLTYWSDDLYPLLLSLALKLARAGRADQAYAVARKLPKPPQAARVLAAAVTATHRWAMQHAEKE
jgi:hypothetical protein